MTVEFNRQYRRTSAAMVGAIEMPEFLNATFTKVIMLCLLAAFVIGYFTQISSLSTSGYEIADLEKKISMLADENQALSSELANYQSISSVQRRISDLKMVPVNQIKYFKAGVDSVAKR